MGASSFAGVCFEELAPMGRSYENGRLFNASA